MLSQVLFCFLVPQSECTLLSVLLFLLYSPRLLTTRDYQITLFGQSVGHRGLRLRGNVLIRKEKEETGWKRSWWSVCCARRSCSFTWWRYYWSTVVECRRQQFAINWPGKWMWRCRQIPHNPLYTLSAVRFLLCNKYNLLKGWVLLWRHVSIPVP